MIHVTTRHGLTRYTLSGLSVPEFVDREIAIRDIESFGPLQVGLMSYVLEVLHLPSSPPLPTPTVCVH